jgi:hypothetical protein
MKVIELPGARWRCRMSFEDLTTDESRTLIVFLMKLRGMSNYAMLQDLTLPTNRGDVEDVDTIDQTLSANSFKMTSGGGTFQPGDYFSLLISGRRELKLVTKQTGLDVDFEPAFRFDKDTGGYVGEPLLVTQPYTKFILTSNDQVGWAGSGKVALTSFDLDFVEAF